MSRAGRAESPLIRLVALTVVIVAALVTVAFALGMHPL